MFAELISFIVEKFSDFFGLKEEQSLLLIHTAFVMGISACIVISSLFPREFLKIVAFIFAMTTVIFHRSRNVVKAYFDVMFPKMSNDAMVEFIINFGTILLAITTLVFSFSAFKNENLYESLMKLYRS